MDQEKPDHLSATAPYRDEISYPKLTETVNFRVKKVLDDQKVLEDETTKRKQMYNKYTRMSNVASMLEYVFVLADVFLATTAAFSPPNKVFDFVNHPAAIIVFAVIGILAGFIKFVQGAINQKKMKHYKLMIVASTTLTTLDHKISKAIMDEKITHEEFEDIQTVMKDWKNGSVHRENSAITTSETMELLATRLRSDMINQLKKINVQP